MPTGQQRLGEGGRQAGGGITGRAAVGGGWRMTAGMRAGFKLRSVEYAATGYFFLV